MKRTEAPHLHIACPRLDDLQRVDFTKLDCLASHRRVRQLAVLGLSDWTIAALTGWRVCDIRRSLSERTQ